MDLFAKMVNGLKWLAIFAKGWFVWMFGRVLNTPLEVIKNGLCMDQLSKSREYNDK